MLLIVYKICIGNIYKQRFYVVLFYVAGVRFLDAEQVIVSNGLLIFPLSLFNIFL